MAAARERDATHLIHVERSSRQQVAPGGLVARPCCGRPHSQCRCQEYAAKRQLKSLVVNTFCPTGVGGGVDPSCGAGGSGGGTKALGSGVGKGELLPDYTLTGYRKYQFRIDGDKAADVTVVDKGGGVVRTEKLQTERAHRGKGVAKQMYLDLFKELKAMGVKKVISGQAQSPGGQAVWESLKRDGVPIKATTNENGKDSYEIDLHEFVANQRSRPLARAVANVFCPTGAGGGVDPSCAAGSGGGTLPAISSSGVLSPTFSPKPFKDVKPIKDDGIHMYHVALIHNIPNIVKHGLGTGEQFKSSQERSIVGKEVGKHLYAFKQLDPSDVYEGVIKDSKFKPNDYAVLRFVQPHTILAPAKNSANATPHLPEDRWQLDPEFGGLGSAVRARDVNIPPSDIEVLTKSGWKPISKAVTSPQEPNAPPTRLT